jgi:hypothetical protein
MNARKTGIIVMRAGKTVKTNCGESCGENETARFGKYDSNIGLVEQKLVRTRTREIGLR